MTVLKTMQKPKTVGVNVGVKNQEVRTETKDVVTQQLGQPSAEQVARRNRRSRSPIDGRRNILTVKGLTPGMIGRWVDNTPERVEQLLEQGYDFVRENVQVGDLSIDGGAKMGATVTKRVGGGKESILMQIPEDWYKADQAEKQKIVDKREAAILGEGKKGSEFYGKVTAQDIVPGRRPATRGSSEEE